jgi:hypothetical protein
MSLALLFAVMSFQKPLEVSLDRAPLRKVEWQALLAKTPKDQKSAVEYLLTYMPLGDLTSLPTDKVAEAVRLAYEARKATSWGKKLPDAIFLDSVVPYASVTEPRRSMRADWFARYGETVKKTKSPGEAALLINARLFKDTKVTYNTRRLRTDQSPPETIAQGMATCTGLSIMLVDALRAVGVPSRLAGIPSWPGRGGNHTWVEVWDKGSWHFVGAAEPDDKGLDHAWFAEEAGRVPGTNPKETIYAVTYKPTGTTFPVVWNDEAQIPAQNVTPNYHLALAKAQPRLMVEVKEHGERVIADVIALNAANGDQCLRGKSLGPQADMNLFLNAPAKNGDTYEVTVLHNGKRLTRQATVKGDTVLRVEMDDADFSEDSAARAWQEYLARPDVTLKADFDANLVKTTDRSAPYKWRTVGTKPKDGWGLVIAMHGGGNGPKSMNDGEWNHMFNAYYKDHPEAGGYVYLALRAPNDEWNGFYDDAICPTVERLIHQFVKFGGVDPNRVYACGASHGGYGAFVIGPKIPYRFAAIHPAAGAGTDGETAGENLRNVRFTWAVGETDTAYGRVERDRKFAADWEKWKALYGGFDGGLEEIKGRGHLINGTEADKIAELLKYTRNAAPKRVIWVQTDDVLKRFYWLEALKPADKGRIDAAIEGNTITLKTEGQGDIALWLSASLIDLTKPVTVVRDGKKKVYKVKPSLTTFREGLEQTADPALSAPVRIVVPNQ